MGDRIGSLEKGKEADLVILEADPYKADPTSSPTSRSARPGWPAANASRAEDSEPCGLLRLTGGFCNGDRCVCMTAGNARQQEVTMSQPLIGNWNYPTSIRFGAGRIRELPDACKAVGLKRPLLVTDPGLAK